MSKLSKDQITAAVIRRAAEVYGMSGAEITPATRFAEDLCGDSLDRVDMTMTLEDEFEIEISDEEALPLQTVADAVDLVTRKIYLPT